MAEEKEKCLYVPIHSFVRFGARPLIWGVIVSRGDGGRRYAEESLPAEHNIYSG